MDSFHDWVLVDKNYETKTYLCNRCGAEVVKSYEPSKSVRVYAFGSNFSCDEYTTFKVTES